MKDLLLFSSQRPTRAGDSTLDGALINYCMPLADSGNRGLDQPLLALH